MRPAAPPSHTTPRRRGAGCKTLGHACLHVHLPPDAQHSAKTACCVHQHAATDRSPCSAEEVLPQGWRRPADLSGSAHNLCLSSRTALLLRNLADLLPDSRSTHRGKPGPKQQQRQRQTITQPSHLCAAAATKHTECHRAAAAVSAESVTSSVQASPGPPTARRRLVPGGRSGGKNCSIPVSSTYVPPLHI